VRNGKVSGRGREEREERGRGGQGEGVGDREVFFLNLLGARPREYPHLKKGYSGSIEGLEPCPTANRWYLYDQPHSRCQFYTCLNI